MITHKKMNLQKRIAVVAQEEYKTDLINWAYFNRATLSKHRLVSTAEIGRILEGTANSPVTKLEGSRNGGYSQLAKMISAGEIDLIVFFCNPFDAFIAEGEIKSLHMIAGKNNLVIATNKLSADFVISSALMDAQPGFNESVLVRTNAPKTDYSIN